jgi:hypothetical protein
MGKTIKPKRVQVGVNLVKVHYKHIWKCHHKPPHVQVIYINKNVKTTKSNNLKKIKKEPR